MSRKGVIYPFSNLVLKTRHLSPEKWKPSCVNDSRRVVCSMEFIYGSQVNIILCLIISCTCTCTGYFICILNHNIWKKRKRVREELEKLLSAQVLFKKMCNLSVLLSARCIAVAWSQCLHLVFQLWNLPEVWCYVNYCATICLSNILLKIE